MSRNEQRKESLFEGEVDEEVGECVCEREGGRKATRINKAKTGQRRLGRQKRLPAQNDPCEPAILTNKRTLGIASVPP